MKKCNIYYLNITQNVIYYSNSVTCNLLLQCPGTCYFKFTPLDNTNSFIVSVKVGTRNSAGINCTVPVCTGDIIVHTYFRVRIKVVLLSYTPFWPPCYLTCIAMALSNKYCNICVYATSYLIM